MRLDTAIYLVAPKPKPPSMPTRRAFLLAGGTFAVGSVLGAACGYSAGVQRGANAAPVDASGGGGEEELKPSGDVELDDLRRLAVKAPIEELMGRAPTFVNSLHKVYPRDAVLWRGAERIVDALLGGAAPPKSPIFVRYLSQVIESGDHELTKNLRPNLDALRRVK